MTIFFRRLSSLIFALLFITNTARAKDQEIVVIGAILPLTGQLGFLGEAIKNGMELALGEIPPQQREHIKIVYEDDAFQPKNAVTAFSKLTTVDKAQILIGAGSPAGNAISKQSDERPITFVSISSDPAVAAHRKHVFNLWVTPEAETAELIPELARNNFTKIARATAVHDGALAVKNAFDLANKGSTTFVGDEEFPADQKDFRTYFTRLKKTSFDVFMALLMPEQLGPFARQAREMGFTQTFVGYEFFEDEKAVELSKGALVGSWYATYGDGSETFLQKYREQFPGKSTLCAANGYDFIKIVALALSQGRATTTELSQIFRELKDFSGALGTYSATGDNRFTLPATIKEVTVSGFEKKDKKIPNHS